MPPKFGKPKDILKKKKKKAPAGGVGVDIVDKSTQPSGGGGGTQRETTDAGIPVFRDQEGRISGFTDPRSGKTFLGASEKDVQALENKLSAQVGGVPVIENPARKQQQADEQQLQESLLNIPEAEQSLLQQQFEAEGGFQEIEGRGERAAEGVAGLGLQPAVALGNLITSGLEQITGKKYGRSNAAELAETDFGKVLGVTTAAAGTAALIGGVASVAGGAIAATTAKLAASLGVSEGVLVGAGALGLSAVTGLNVDLIIDKLLDRKETQEIQSSVNTIGEMSSTIVGTYRSGGYGNNPANALSQLNSLDEDLRIVESQLQQAVILDGRVRQSGEYIDILADIQDQRSVIQEGRADILAETPSFDAATIAEYMEIFRLIEEDKREELIKRGFLKRTI